MKYLLLFFCIAVTGCKKNETVMPLVYSEASYRMQITMHWTAPQFTVPAGAHFTSVIGTLHTRDTFLWKENMVATPGLEDVAEVGNTTKMNAEIDAMIAANKSANKFQIAAPALNGSTEATLKVSTVFSNVSFASMLAPSPDWFMGVSNVSLLQNNHWLDSLTVPVKVYDAGTEDGDVFGYNNPSTIPQQSIKLLTAAGGSVLANGNASIGVIGYVRFTKL